MKFLLFTFLTLAIFSAALTVDAQTYSGGSLVPRGDNVYQAVVKIPGLDPNSQSTGDYVNALYILAITAAALMAFVKIIFGGVKWMLSDVVTDKSSAKKDIQGALLGLLIVLAAVLVLNTINQDLTKLNFLENAQPISITVQGDRTQLPATKIGDEYGWFCGDNAFALTCDPSHERQLTQFKKSCLEDAKGTVQETWFIGYKCISR
jgi:hypothetical protein